MLTSAIHVVVLVGLDHVSTGIFGETLATRPVVNEEVDGGGG
jgi:hypothetical protein